MTALLLLLSVAEAHRPGISFAQVEAERVALTFARPELAALAPMDDLDAARVLVAEGTLGRATLTQGGAACVVGDAEVREVENDGVEVAAPLQCPGEGERSFTAGYLDAMAPGHRVFLEAAGQPVAVLDASAASAAFVLAEPDRLAVAGRFLVLGMEHIVTGYDHLAFLAALLLVATSLRQMLWVVTGFTVAHSITLTLAALEVFALPASVVEPAIAASILFVGLENLARPPARRRMATTFVLGLIHGFGFAGLLADLGIPRDGRVVALASFNLGVEVGQAALVAVTLPGLLWLRRRAWWGRRAVPVLSVGLALAGAYWLVERVFFGG